MRENCNIDLPINLQRNCHKGYVYITVPDHVAVELVKLNDLELKGQNLVIEEAVAMPKSFNSNLNKFTSPNRFAALTPNQQEDKCDFEIADASNREFDFESAGNGRNRQTKSNRQKVVNSPKRRSQVVVNKHPENQTAFGKLIARPENDVTNPSKENDVVNLGKETDNILIFSDSIPGKIKMCEFNKVLKNGNAKHLFFPGATSQQLLQYLDVNLQLYGPQTVIIHVGINDLLNDPGHSNVENILKNFRVMVKKCREFNVKNIFLSGLVYNKRTELSLLENLHLRIVELCSKNGIMYVDNRNIYGMHLYHDKLHLLPSGKRILINNFISNLTFLTQKQVYHTII